eukprot:CCRYP_007210-RA/>CCRYP_007210-RA protein AED:0.23 eAED:0.23 QI:133/1/1/1/1/1/2/259/269
MHDLSSGRIACATSKVGWSTIPSNPGMTDDSLDDHPSMLLFHSIQHLSVKLERNYITTSLKPNDFFLLSSLPPTCCRQSNSHKPSIMRTAGLFFYGVIAAVFCLTLHHVSAFTPPRVAFTTTMQTKSSHTYVGPFDASMFIESSALRMSQENEQVKQENNLPVFLDPGTKGGAVVLSILLFLIPILVYQISTNVFGADEIEVGRNIGVGFSVVTMLLWGSTYIFRVATKDMTYAKQLKDYEDAVIRKRLEELDEDEVQALVEDIEREEF